MSELMDPDCVEIDSAKNSSKSVDMESDEVHSVDMEGGVKRKWKDRSVVWNFFEKDKNAIKGAKKVQCKCNKCHSILLYDSKQGTGNLLRHKERCHGKDFHDVGQMLFNSDMALRSSRFNQKTFRDLLVAATVRHELPLSFVDYKGTLDLLGVKDPRAVTTENSKTLDVPEMKIQGG
ncbi:zinc finger, BED-type [Artemisia annua]|uniref:Zinc finger, BED-type n=1 Tax=Artemisia annua TaxID=35608 RepID=A0A2U1QDN6_ARTAN|nr:zinc finger, BED-type [Artemisia annua]